MARLLRNGERSEPRRLLYTNNQKTGDGTRTHTVMLTHVARAGEIVILWGAGSPAAGDFYMLYKRIFFNTLPYMELKKRVLTVIPHLTTTHSAT